MAVAASLVGVLALTACSSGGDSDGDASPSGAPTSAGTGEGTGDGSGDGSGGGSSSAAGDLEGSWLATTDGKAVALVVTGDKAGLFATGGTVCSGSAGERTIKLSCTDGSKDRASGTVDSVGKGELKVTWKSDLGVETYTKAEGGKLPTGLPTAGLGS
ncbi:hypothetical protein ACIPPR_13800 [Streptomyces nigra]|uniref:hypothetical protein n=1 Tax=Streptomyces nigra TaxID=1827580 RepID=UPI003415B087